MPSAMPGEMPRFQHSAAAPALDIDPVVERQPASQPRRPVFQPSLFASPRVVSFESFAPESVEPSVKKISQPRKKARKVLPGQQSFGFDSDTMQYEGEAAGYRSAYGGPEEVLEPAIQSDDPVALPAHRMIAAAFDSSMVIMAATLFYAIFHVAGGQILLNKHTLPLVVGIAAVFFVLYKVLWCLAGGDTAGMRWAHVRLVGFEGQEPTRQQRFYRLASGYLSLLAAGLGLLWAFVDEESLTWHDHMSKTFPTPY